MFTLEAEKDYLELDIGGNLKLSIINQLTIRAAPEAKQSKTA